eukprot:TRINITY_DN5212_c0_g1_i1.p1 TRINITY_DN5212_c0_g1~~TRINITY_DN5212_c0_g1_i1.p1  ORF type:complete len:274 (+),score=82.94 TRINITY_DN5212_c0_g1_i1:47-823(+)
MFEAKFRKASSLKKIIEAIRELVTEGKFECTVSGISLQAMDAAHVSLVQMLLKASGFESYRCERNVALGLSLETLSKVLKCARPDDTVTLRADEDSDFVTFVFKSPNKVSKYEVKLLDLQADSLGIPDTEYETVIRMPSDEFQRICTNLTMWGDNVKIATSKEGITFAVEGEESGASGNVFLKPHADVDNEGKAVTIESTKDISLGFALRKLLAFTKATPLTSSVALSISGNVPLSVEYIVDNDLGYIRFYLAPKIED